MYYLILGLVSFGVIRVSYDEGIKIRKKLKGESLWVIGLKYLGYLGGAVLLSWFLTAVIAFGEFNSLQTFSILFVVSLIAGASGWYASYKHN